jgi:hypothetical protein
MQGFPAPPYVPLPKWFNDTNEGTTDERTDDMLISHVRQPCDAISSGIAEGYDIPTTSS